MFARIFLIAAVALISGPASAGWVTPKRTVPPRARAAAPAAKATPASRARPAPPKTPTPPMQFYVAKGAADACGRGCDRWIQLEGQIDRGAAGRFRNFFAQLRNWKTPVELYLPGG